MEESWVGRVREWIAGGRRAGSTHSVFIWVSSPSVEGIVPSSEFWDRILRWRKQASVRRGHNTSKVGTHSAVTLPLVQDTPSQRLMHGSPTVQLTALLQRLPLVAS